MKYNAKSTQVWVFISVNKTCALFTIFIKLILLKNQLGFKKRKLEESSEHDDIINIMEESNYHGMFKDSVYKNKKYFEIPTLHGDS